MVFPQLEAKEHILSLHIESGEDDTLLTDFLIPVDSRLQVFELYFKLYNPVLGTVWSLSELVELEKELLDEKEKTAYVVSVLDDWF